MSSRPPANERVPYFIFFGAAVVLLIIGLVVGFSSMTNGPTSTCGSVLGGTETSAGCGGVVSAWTTWTWLLIIASVIFFSTAAILDAILKHAYRQVPQTR